MKDSTLTEQRTQPARPASKRLLLLLILLLFSLLTLYNSARLPLGEAADETDHYQYLRFVARTGHPPLTQAQRAEAGFKGGLAPLYYWLVAWPVAMVGEETPPDIRRVDSRPERHLPSDGLGINHVLHTLDEQWPWRGQVLAWHLVRLLSLPLGWITIVATYLLARRLLPARPAVALGAAAFVAFLPRFVISSAVINDDNLVFALTALLLLTQVAILQGDHRPRLFALMGALFGLALLTKYFSLILIPEIIFTLAVCRVAGLQGSKVAGSQGRRVAKSQGRRVAEVQGRMDADSRDSSDATLPAPRSPLPAPPSPLPALRSPLLAFIIALGLIAGPWFTFIVVRFNRVAELGWIPGLAASLGEPQITEGLVGLLAGQSVRPPAATYALPDWLGLLYRSFWFEYGWMQIFAPWWIYGLFTLFLLAAFWGLARYAAGSTKSASRTAQYPKQRSAPPLPAPTLFAPRATLPASPLPWLLALHLTLFLSVVLARYILSATIDTGQGRHLYPALPVIALLISLGLNHLPTPHSPLSAFRSTLPAPRSTRPAHHPLLPTPYFLLLLLPAALTLHPPAFILPHYRTRPVTITRAAELPIIHRHQLEFGEGLFLAGFDSPPQALSGDALAVTLYWRAEREAEQDYLLSLCLEDEENRPIACWRGWLGGGEYPARAWETGDTLIDTVHIPLPACDRLPEQFYRLHLALWPQSPALPMPETVITEAVLAHTFDEPQITLRRPSDSLGDRGQAVELWLGGERLAGPTRLERGETVTQLTYDSPPDETPNVWRSSDHDWPAVPHFDTSLHLPCDEDPAPLAHLDPFIAGPALPPGVYRSARPEVTLNLAGRRRNLAPIQSDLLFAPYLSPLTLQLPGQATVDLTQSGSSNAGPPAPYSIRPGAALPVTLRWQARQWMADPLVVSLKLLDRDFLIGGQRVATLGDRYPNVLWVPTEIVEETYPVQLKPDAPPGLYQLELSIVHQDRTRPDGFAYLPLIVGETDVGPNLYPLAVRLLDPAHDSPPANPASAQLGDTIRLAGYDLENALSQAQNLKLTLYWQSTGPIPIDFTVFTQLIGPDGQVWAQWDNPPQAGRYPTTAWTAPDRVVDRYTLSLAPGAPPGQYRLLVGMYDPATGQRLPITANGRPQPDQALELTRLTLEP